MKKDEIITLQNNEKYLLLDETILYNSRYFYAVKLLDNEEDVTNDYLFIKEVIKNSEIYIEIEKDNNIQKQLLTIFSVNYADDSIK